MFLRCTPRKKDGKEHHYWNVVENRRVSAGRVVQRQVLYLGEINDSQREAWRKRALFDHLTQRWKDLFNAKYEVLLYDLTSTCFESDPPVYYLVGTPKGRLTQYEQSLTEKPWCKAREGVEVKLLPQGGEVYVLAQSRDRISKERAMRRRQLKKLWARLRQLRAMELTRDELPLKLGAAKQQSPSAWRLVQIEVPEEKMALRFSLRKDKLRNIRRREGRYLLRTNLVGREPAEMWEFYIQLVHVEEAFRNLKGDLALRPIHHQKEDRIEAHIFVAFMAFAMHVTLRRRLRDLAPGLTPRSVLERFAAV